MREAKTNMMDTVTQMISAQAAASPDAVALTGQGQQLTYRDLQHRADAVAHSLRELGVGTDQPVALLMRRSPALAVGALGVLRAGAAYLPLDPGFPAERQAFMMRDANAPVVLTERALACRLPSGPWQCLLLEDVENRVPQPAQASPPPGPNHLAYIIYTSGSTGEPKGVLIEHASLSNLIAWHNQSFAVTAADRASHISSFGFDAAVWELWPHLAAGASVHFVDDEARMEPEMLREWLHARRITISFVPTAMAEHIIASP